MRRNEVQIPESLTRITPPKLRFLIQPRYCDMLYEAANVMLTSYKGELKLKDWAFAIAKRSTRRKARIALAHIHR